MLEKWTQHLGAKWLAPKSFQLPRCHSLLYLQEPEERGKAWGLWIHWEVRVVNRDTKSSLFYWICSFLCAVSVCISQMLSEDTSPVPAWPLKGSAGPLPVTSRQRCAFKHWTFPLAHGVTTITPWKSSSLAPFRLGKPCTPLTVLGGLPAPHWSTQQAEEGGISHRIMCTIHTHPPDILLNKFVVYSSD